MKLLFQLLMLTLAFGKIASADPAVAAAASRATQPQSPHSKKNTPQAKKRIQKKNIKKIVATRRPAKRVADNVPLQSKKAAQQPPAQSKKLAPLAPPNPALLKRKAAMPSLQPPTVKAPAQRQEASAATSQGQEAPADQSATNAHTDADDDDDDESEEDEIDGEEEEESPQENQHIAIQQKKAHKKILIRVLLREVDAEPKTTFSIQGEGGFYLTSPVGAKNRIAYKHEIIHLIAMHRNMFMQTQHDNYRRLRCNEICITPRSGKLKIDNVSYEGSIHIRIDEKRNKIQLINNISLDDYIYSVLLCESLSYWPKEVHKVQAIASRSYAVHRIIQARRNNPNTFYDIKNNNFHQVYNGDHPYEHLRKAVHETENEVLTYRGEVAQTMFDICCGGIISSYMKHKDVDKPYLFRKTKCIYCKDKSSFSWTAAFNKESFLALLLKHPRTAKKATKLGKITGIGVKEKDLANIVHRISIHGSKANVIFTRSELKAVLQQKIKSNAFTVKKTDNDIIFHGYGFGHNIGLCQLGARELVARGWSYDEILGFYFPKTNLVRLSLL